MDKHPVSPQRKTAVALFETRMLSSIGPNDINRLFALPPEVPEPRVQAIRKAFDATLNDPEFNQDMKKGGIIFKARSPKRVEEVVSSLLSMPTDERQEIKNILGID